MDKKGLLYLLLLLFSSCASLPKESTLMQKAEVESISAYELRDRLNSFALQFAMEVERAADEIIAESNDPRITENALLWKMNSIPAAQSAIFLSDPFAALIDVSVLCLQMQLYFEKGAGKDLFGERQVLAINGAKKLGTKVISIWKIILGEFDPADKGVKLMSQWALENPIHDLSFIRVSPSDSLFAFIHAEELGLTETVGSIAVNVQNVEQRLTMYVNLLPKQARWQADYLINQKLKSQELQRSFDNFDRITDSFEEMTGIITQSPDLINSLHYTTLAQITKERIALLDALGTERSALMVEVDRQRLESLSDFKMFSEKILSNSKVSAEDIVDHFYLRLLQILVLIYVVALTTIIVLKKTLWPKN